MATQLISTTIKKVIRVSREEIEQALRDKFGVTGEVEWNTTSEGMIYGADIYAAEVTESTAEKI